MSVAFLMHETESVEELAEVIASCWLCQAATKGHEVEELTATDELKNDKLHQLGALLGINLLALVNLDKSNDVIVVKLGESLHFCIDQFLK